MLSEMVDFCMQALVALLLPTHFFYAFIYYTDVGSVTFVLASYLVSPQLCESMRLAAYLSLLDAFSM